MRELLDALGWDNDRLMPDKHKLDLEFERHPQDIATVCEYLADARQVLALTSATKSQLEIEARGDSIAAFNRAGTKYTVGDLNAAVEETQVVRDALRNVLACQRDVEMWSGLLKAFEAKTSALKHLSELWQAGYYTTSSSHEPPARVRRGRERA